MGKKYGADEAYLQEMVKEISRCWWQRCSRGRRQRQRQSSWPRCTGSRPSSQSVEARTRHKNCSCNPLVPQQARTRRSTRAPPGSSRFGAARGRDAWTTLPFERLDVDDKEAEATAEVTSKDVEKMLLAATPEERKRVLDLFTEAKSKCSVADHVRLLERNVVVLGQEHRRLDEGCCQKKLGPWWRCRAHADGVLGGEFNTSPNDFLGHVAACDCKGHVQKRRRMSEYDYFVVSHDMKVLADAGPFLLCAAWPMPPSSKEAGIKRECGWMSQRTL